MERLLDLNEHLFRHESGRSKRLFDLAYPFYPAAMAELELRRGNRDAARMHFSAALELARNPAERRFLEKRVRTCGRPSGSERRGLTGPA